MKVLVVDDQELVLLSLEKTLKDHGYDVATANTAITAIEVFDFFENKK